MAVPAITSTWPSPFTSPVATVTPPAYNGPNGAPLASSTRVAPLYTRTRPLPVPPPTSRSARPSPSMSPVATYTPPRKSGPKGVKRAISAASSPSKTCTRPSPGPVAVTRSGVPSPLKSPVATRTAPVNPPNG